MGRVPGNELPGYDHLVPPGQNLVVRLKLTLMGLKPWAILLCHFMADALRPRLLAIS
jgi:hypothetical protein